jgi:hypothetical protein
VSLVVLIPTGRLEHAALAGSLQQLFPAHSFRANPADEPFDGFTSGDVSRILLTSPVMAQVSRLAQALVAAIVPGRRGEPADYAAVVEDLELVNAHQPDRVVQVFRGAVERHISLTWANQHRQSQVRAEVASRGAFHLFVPMTEAYFFGDPPALTRARAVLPPQLPPNLDLEQFRTADPTFLGLPPDPRSKRQGRRIIHMPLRERHPKSYLHYLCDPTLNDPDRIYQETDGGAAALLELDWQQVLSAPPHCPFLHAFLDDLAEALNAPLPFVNRAHASPLTCLPGPGVNKNTLLRNI